MDEEYKFHLRKLEDDLDISNILLAREHAKLEVGNSYVSNLGASLILLIKQDFGPTQLSVDANKHPTIVIDVEYILWVSVSH